MELRTDHFILDGQGPTITAFGYEINWLIKSVSSSDRGYEFYRELIVERLSDHRGWHWSKKHGRWTVVENGDIVDGWVRG